MEREEKGRVPVSKETTEKTVDDVREVTDETLEEVAGGVNPKNYYVKPSDRTPTIEPYDGYFV
ncbi:MAG: hypothetical protein E7Z99_00555 [Coriobacteriaceae bacterium]|jgi:hypothetical protein|nr:hypothetical protein [Coriobacteriaceae bacterium]